MIWTLLESRKDGYPPLPQIQLSPSVLLLLLAEWISAPIHENRAPSPEATANISAFRRNYDCLIWEQHGKNQSYSPPKLEQGCLQHQPVLHPLVPAGNVAMLVSASPGNAQPWHSEHSVLVGKEKTFVITEQNKALLSGTFWTRPIPQSL